MRLALAALIVAIGLPTAGDAAMPADPASPSPTPAASPGTASTLAYDVFTHVLSEPQRAVIDRDPRCRDARSLSDAFVASAGAALQTGVDAMGALEKCAVLQRVGSDWSDYRDYVVLAAAAIAYAVGDRADNSALLRRAVDDAAHVHGYDASAVSVRTYTRAASEQTADSNVGHRMGDGPIEASKDVAHDIKRVAADSGTYGALASRVGAAATQRLSAPPAATH